MSDIEGFDVVKSIIQDMDDSKLGSYYTNKKLELQRLEQATDCIKPVILAIEFELEIRRLAGSYEELKGFRSRMATLKYNTALKAELTKLVAK